MEKEEFVKRLTELRLSKDVSAREMSLSLGLSEGFINKIENGGSLPNMTNFLYICDYFGISPKEFFDFVPNDRTKLSRLLNEAMPLSDEQLDVLLSMIQAMKK